MADAPAVPTALEPSINTFDTTPLFTWTREFGVEEYQVQIDSQTPQPASADTSCATTTCSWQPANPRAVGNHSWRVKAINSVGESAFSTARNFEILPCTAPTDRDLTNATVATQLTEAACQSLSAHTGYVVAAPGGNLELHAGDTIRLNPGFRVESGARLRCRVDP